MRMLKRYFYYMIGLMAMMSTACTSDDVRNEDLPMPDGMGRIRIAICTPENSPELTTRAVSVDTTWLEPDHEWERLQTFRILICKASNNEVVQIITGDKSQMVNSTARPSARKETAVLTSEPLLAGDYNIYATANYADGYQVGSILNPDRTVSFSNGYSETNIPMTGKLTKDDGTLKTVTVKTNETEDAGTIIVWRVMAKMQFELTNLSSNKLQVVGIEVEPINQISSDPNNTADFGKGLVYLFSKDNLTSTQNLVPGTTIPDGQEGLSLPPSARTNVGAVEFTPSTPLTLEPRATDYLFFYVSETDATFTSTENQLSVRFKIKRQKAGTTGSSAEDWFDDEVRYAMTTNYDTTTSAGGFNVIRRNDWIHVPVYLTDWSFRIEALQFVPIAGYQTTVVSADALTATFKTGGNICVRPMMRNNGDPEGVWRSIYDSFVNFGVPTNADGDIVYSTKAADEATYTTAAKSYKYYKRYEALYNNPSDPNDKRNGTGMIITGDTYILKHDRIQDGYDPEAAQAPFCNLFDQLPTGDFVGSLQNDDYMEGKVTLTLFIRLENYLYSFSYNIVMAKNS